MDIRVDLNKTGYLGLDEELRCKGFRLNIDVNSNITSIDFYYSLCVKGLNDELIETSTHVKNYTNQNLRPVLDNEGNPVMETIQGSQIFETVEVPLLDENSDPVLDGDGNPLTELVSQPVLDGEGNPTYNTVNQPVMVGVISHWLEAIGNDIILPDLQVTLNSISSLYL